MLHITIPAVKERWDEINEVFLEGTEEVTLDLEHSLVSLSKWESKWCVPFLSKRDKTTEEVIDYIKCMTITKDVPDYIYENLTEVNFKCISSYIEAPMSATWFSEDKMRRPSRETVTSELIYYWMIALNIPMECQYWHLNRLMTLIKVCNIKNTPPKKMGRRELMNRNAALNASRRQRFNSRG